MATRAAILLLALTAAGAAVAATLPTPSVRYALPPPDARFETQIAGIDAARELAADSGAPKSRPLRYAVSREIHNAAFSRNVQGAGEWRDLPGAMALWRLPVQAAGARTLDFGFRKLFLPQGAQLFVSNGSQRLGPYTDSDNTRSGEFWTPLLHGDAALIEVLLPQAMKPYLEVDLGTVHAGFRDILAPAAQAKSFADPGEGSGSCNLDTICPQGDPWRSEINAEAILVFNGGFCSGQLVNDTAQDRVPYLSTANHCISTPHDAQSLVVYWKYENPVCRAPFSAASGQPVPSDAAIAQTGGAELMATYAPADFTLVRLHTPPPATAHVYWNGWDRSETPFGDAVVMHHPVSDAKRLSFAAGIVTVEDDAGSADLPGQHHWFVDHYSVGTTEEGSSGSGLIDGNHRLRGVLSGGEALCSNLAGADYYGRLSTAWEGGGTSATRVRDWLDPQGSGTQTVNGIAEQPTTIAVTLATSVPTLIAGQTVTFTATASGGTQPYTYAFDIDGDGDGVADNLDASAASMIAAYPAAFSGNVRVTITDHAGAQASDSRALIVQSQSVSVQPNGFGVFPETLLCGDQKGDIDPGERWAVTLNLINNGSAPTSNGYAVFAQDAAQSNAAKLVLETPAVALPALAPGAGTSVQLRYAVATDAVCGAPIRINYLGTADDHGFSSNPTTVVNEVIGAAACAITTVCPAQIAPLVPKRGNFYDSTRSGSGLTQIVTPVPGGDLVFFGAWFTGDASRQPTWYVLNDALRGNQVNSMLYRTHLDAPNQFPESASAVGTAQVSVISATKFVYTWVLNGKPGGGVYVPVVDDVGSSLRSWYNPGESGWGTFDELFPSAGSAAQPFLFGLDFLYDAAGNPRWTTASDSSYADGDLLDEMVVRPSCPSCAWLDYTLGARSVGTQRYKAGTGAPSITTNLSFPNAFPGTWIRSDLPLTPLVPPQ